MKIKKELKYATFEYDEETKKFLIIDTESGGVVELNKIYAFAFMRFVIRMAQRNWLKQNKGKKMIDKEDEIMLGLELDKENIHEDQMNLFNNKQI
jgi:hypothetical protein|tara:strand:- start:522 stop:806 length:285 start_codon:yes stop_codon:yes gene_type:complete